MFYILVFTLIKVSLCKEIIYTVTNIQYCPNFEGADRIIKNMKYNSYNRTIKTMSWDFELDEPFGANYEIKVEIYKRSSTGWKSVPFVPFTRDPCSVLMMLIKPQLISWLNSMNVDKCPVPAGTYKNITYVFPGKKISSNIIIPIRGDFKFRHIYRNYETKKTAFCGEAFVTSGY